MSDNERKPAADIVSTDVRETVEFHKEVSEALGAMTPVMVERIAANQMPACFEPTRASYVAMAKLLKSAYEQLDRLIKARTH